MTIIEARVYTLALFAGANFINYVVSNLREWTVFAIMIIMHVLPFSLKIVHETLYKDYITMEKTIKCKEIQREWERIFCRHLG